MSERTGVAALDAAIETFFAEDAFNPDHPDEQGNGWTLELMREPSDAFGKCASVSIQFADRALALGVEAFLPWQPDAQSLGEANCGEAWYPDVAEAVQALGHCLTYLRSNDDELFFFTVDWSACQFGLAYAGEFPLVQRLAAAGSWQRAW